ncbi:putative cell wall-binding protein [Bacillus niacini]|uniref:Cell wall-binding protein n=1 Tax=Neobacillus niacini TaxID=86668 RepID=A0A852TEJ6_9BACI|nr:cell wall-binding repeat-containing protein [Neobacillus niacini]NYE05788.1 putative cell wall-binding protein [Neobacillus niacini]
MRKVFSILVVFLLVVTSSPQSLFAAENFERVTSQSQALTYPCAQPGVEYTCSEINEMLTESAIAHGIPPEVAKAVAFRESNWQQWEDKEQTIPTFNKNNDGGIGIMQVTDKSGRFNEESLKNDIQYNIDKGLEILNEKWELGIRGVIPTINDNSRDVIENWYFAVLAYNGVVEKNSPTKKLDGSRNATAYQEEVFKFIEENNGMTLKTLPFTREDFKYDPADEDTALIFNKLHYEVPGPLTKSRQLFSEGDKVYTVVGTNLRTSKDGAGNNPLSSRQVAEILEETVFYDTSLQSPFRHWVRYHIQLQDGRTGYVTSGALEPITSRVSGATRYETAIEISKEGWQDGADTVVLAQAMNFPDALAGAPLAYKYNAPILLTETAKLTDATKKEIERLGADRVIILGSQVAVSKQVEDALVSMNLKEVKRIGGATRFETAQLIANELGSTNGKAIVATGFEFPDALAVAPYAARNAIPILLTNPNYIPESTMQALQGKSTIYAIGGENALNAPVINKLPGTVQQIAGETRYDTAAEIINAFDLGDQQALVATGTGFADALTGAVLAAKKNASLLLVTKDDVRTPIETIIKQRSIHTFTLLGGSDVVNVDNELAELATYSLQ